MEKALDGIKIVDLGHVLAAPFCTMVLADLGADVIKVEPPYGDDSRAFGPFIDESDRSGEQSAYFISINRNKKSICIDLKKEKGKAIFREMIQKADVVVENFRPTTMEKLGFSYQDMKKIKSDIIYCSICGFGHDSLPEYASKPAYDMVAQAFSGLMSITGPLGGPPVRVGSSVGDIVAGYQGAIGILAALNHRDRTGEGQHIDISMVDGLVYTLENAIARFTVSGKIPGPLGSAHPAITPFQSFRGADKKWIITPIGNDSLWKKFCSAIGREDLTDHPLYSTNPLRTRNREALIAILEEEFLKKPADEWLQIMDAHGLPNSPLNTIDRVVGDPNINYRKMIVSMEQPHVGTMKVVGSPFHMTQTPGAVRTPAPLLGQHTTDYLEDELGYSKIIIRDLIAEGVIFSKD